MNMVEMLVKDTSIKVTCDNLEDLFSVYHELRHKVLIVNGDELKPTGPVVTETSHSYFAGYTKGYFKKYFEEN